MPRVCHLLTGVLTVCAAVFLVALSGDGGNRGHGHARQGAWPSYGADPANSKYSPFDQITPNNVKDLRITWRWSSPENAILQDHPDLWAMVDEATP